MDEDSEEEKGMNGDLYPLINEEVKIQYNVLHVLILSKLKFLNVATSVK